MPAVLQMNQNVNYFNMGYILLSVLKSQNGSLKMQFNLSEKNK
jgi:hypothetical protein